MTEYIIRFFEKTDKNGSLTTDSDEREIKNIDDEQEVRRAIMKAFTLAIHILNNKIKQVAFSVADYHNETIWGGEGIVTGDKLEIISLTKK